MVNGVTNKAQSSSNLDCTHGQPDLWVVEKPNNPDQAIYTQFPEDHQNFRRSFGAKTLGNSITFLLPQANQGSDEDVST